MLSGCFVVWLFCCLVVLLSHRHSLHSTKQQNHQTTRQQTELSNHNFFPTFTYDFFYETTEKGGGGESIVIRG